MQPLKLLAPAKINLHLRVAPIDGSGFHPLLSWMCTVRLFDTLTIEDASGELPLSLQCDDPKLPCDQTNLIIRAAEKIRHEGAIRRSAKFCLEKRIPSGGGLGGGSSDAARTLLSLNQLWNLGLSVEQLSGIAAQIGSDVPFFLYGPSSICTGRGEIVRPIARPKPRWAGLILPDYGIATPAVYKKLDELGLANRQAVESPPDWQQWAELSAGPLLSRLVNDLEAPAFAICPALAKLRAEIEQTIGRIVRMSGSGSSLFTLFDEFAEAESTIVRIKECFGVRAQVVELAPDFEDDLS